ncbi:MAG: bifunctional riboflavin kinase/FAD synthetase [Gammaproteobacteria bacterium]|nr:bifunctional riboflavin kinase/FAD synthetase [Gammaproteobacteria bacterium]
MQLIRGLQNIHVTQPQLNAGCVATIGNFDGVHLGHQAVLGQLAEKAAELRLVTTLITFEPQPMEYFVPEKVPARLTRFREKILALQRYSVDRVCCLAFNDKLAKLTAEEFIQDILVKRLNVKYLVVGDDFRFGLNRAGNFDTLVDAGKKFGFQVVSMHTFEIDGTRVSSTRIRTALEQGDMTSAEKLLGRSYRMSGRVAHGEKLGRELGFPTANIHLHRHASPVQGIFAVEVFGLDNEPLQGVASVGTRPTVNETKALLEVYLFDFNQDIYGRHIQVSFLKKLRDEAKFDSLDALVKQIQSDVDQAQAYFAA